MAASLENYAALLREMRRAEEAEELEPRAHAIRANQAGSNADSLEPVVCVNLVSKKTVRRTALSEQNR